MANAPAPERRSRFNDVEAGDPIPGDEGRTRDHVLDATALLCVLFAEDGCDQIEALLPRALASTVNYHEVLAKFADLGVAMIEARAMFDELEVGIVSVDRKQADVGSTLRDGGTGLSLGERSFLALAKTLGAVAVTTDPRWTRIDHGIRIKVIHQPDKPPTPGE